MRLPIVKTIEAISTWSGKGVAWLVIPNVLALVYEVIARYILKSPTIWSYEVTYFLYGTHFLIGAAYTLSINGHIRIDVLHMHLPPRAKAVVEVLGYLLLFFPYLCRCRIYISILGNGRKVRTQPLAPPSLPLQSRPCVEFLSPVSSRNSRIYQTLDHPH